MFTMTKIETFKSPQGRGYTASLERSGQAVATVHDRGDGSAPSIYPIGQPMRELLPELERAALQARAYLPSVEVYLTTLFCEAMQ